MFRSLSPTERSAFTLGRSSRSSHASAPTRSVSVVMVPITTSRFLQPICIEVRQNGGPPGSIIMSPSSGKARRTKSRPLASRSSCYSFAQADEIAKEILTDGISRQLSWRGGKANSNCSDAYRFRVRRCLSGPARSEWFNSAPMDCKLSRNRLEMQLARETQERSLRGSNPQPPP